MENADRRQIDRCIDEIVRDVDIIRLWPRLKEVRVFNEDDGNISTWEANLTSSEIKRDIIDSIKTRGPYAFKNFVQSLRVTNQHSIADSLEGKTNVCNNLQPISNNNVNTESPNNETERSVPGDNFYTRLQVAEKPLQIIVRKATVFRDSPDDNNSRGVIIGTYPMRSKPRGFVLIITIIHSEGFEKRSAAEHDEKNLIQLFEEMGFEVEHHRDLTGAEINEVVKKFSKKKAFANVASSFVIISGHGNSKVLDGGTDTEIHGADGESGTGTVYCNDIINLFTAGNCRRLTGKPKVFIFQSCRAAKTSEGFNRTENDGLSLSSMRNFSDILVAQSTMFGDLSYRDTLVGSWYIQVLCEVFMNHAHDKHLLDLFTMIDRRLMHININGKSQTSTTKSIGFNMHCYLHPGLFEGS